jgi:hypothetical protein
MKRKQAVLGKFPAQTEKQRKTFIHVPFLTVTLSFGGGDVHPLSDLRANAFGSNDID